MELDSEPIQCGTNQGMDSPYIFEGRLQPRKWERLTSVISQISSPDLSIGMCWCVCVGGGGKEGWYRWEWNKEEYKGLNSSSG